MTTRVCLWTLACLLADAPAQSTFPLPLITQRIDESRMTILRGNTHPLARPEFDRGTAPASLPMERMLLVLKRSAEQEAALEKLIDEQLDRSSMMYHKWLTPEQFGQRFGLSSQDLRTITAWLASHGFEVSRVSAGRTLIEFSGTAGKVTEAFHTAIRKYVIDGREYWANAGDPLVPEALVSAIAGVSTLNSFPRGPGAQLAGGVSRWGTARPQANIPSPCEGSGLQSTGACFGISPYDFAAIYNVLPLWRGGVDGSGQTIAIVAESNIDIRDPGNFRKLFGLPPNDPMIIVNGRDPGLINSPQPIETEAVIDVEWAGAVAPGATIDLVISASTNSTPGFDLSAEYIVNHNLAPVLSASYGVCDSQLGSSLSQFYNSLWQQAAAQGITVLMGTGDSGSACDDTAFATAPSPARHGLVADGSAATPYNVAIGGTDFSDYSNAGKYWGSNDDSTTLASALGYIPETTWNDTCTNAALGPSPGLDAETNCNYPALLGFVRTTGGGGGRSSHFGKPSWQVGPGVPDDGRRDVPDVSFFAGSEITGHFYLACEADREAEIKGASCDASRGPLTHFFGGSGVSFAVPAFAGIMALVNQNTGSRQGNANAVLYPLAVRQSGLDCNASGAPSAACIFHDVTAGTIAMPCAKGSPDCVTKNSANHYGILSGYDAGPGYDLATGLGSVDAFNLVTASGWGTNSPTAPVLNAGGVLNAASLAPGPVAPGSIASVFGAFGVSSPASSSGYPLPPILSGLALKGGSGFPVPLFFVSAAQANIQVPWELTGQSQSTLTAIIRGQPGVPQTIHLAPFAPGIFRMNERSQGAILDASYRLVDGSNPTSAHAVIQIYCTGLGVVSNRPPSGAAAPSDPPATTVETPIVQIGGLSARVLFSGLTPGFAGLYQVNAEVPDGVPNGNAVPVVMSIGGAASNTVVIAVQ